MKVQEIVVRSTYTVELVEAPDYAIIGYDLMANADEKHLSYEGNGRIVVAGQATYVITAFKPEGLLVSLWEDRRGDTH